MTFDLKAVNYTDTNALGVNEMNLYIFENVLWDYTAGQVVIAASTLEQALDTARYSYNDLVDTEAGWKEPTVYSTGPEVLPGIKHECWGGS